MKKSKQIYYFKVALDTDFKRQGKEKPYRIIAVQENQSLSTLARSIVTSFGFYFDHCYGFYDNFQNPYKSKEMYELFTDLGEEPTRGASGVTYVKIPKAFTHIGKKMNFLFDYGDNWFFTIELLDKKPLTTKQKLPHIMKKVGNAPEQYPPLEEEWDEKEESIILNEPKKGKEIQFAPEDKITDEAYQLIEILFNIKSAYITNESSLLDFSQHDNNISLEEIYEGYMELIGEKFGVVIPEVIAGETRIWKVVELINEKQRKLLSPLSQRTRKRVVS